MKLNCPMCRAEMDVPKDYETRPFCSPRCKKLDLSNWLDGKYRLPRELEPEDLENLSDEERDAVLETALGSLGAKNFH